MGNEQIRCDKKHYSKLKAMSKITKIPSEIRIFFSVKNVAVPLWAHLHTYLKMSTWTVVVLVE